MTEFISISCVTCYKLPVKTGTKGELLAKMFLMKRGYRILAENLPIYQGKQVGEIDILAFKNGCLYIVEVKTIDRRHSIGWIRSDILTRKKYLKLRLIRSMVLALKSDFSNIDRGFVHSLAGAPPDESFLQSSGRNRLRDILVPEFLDQIKLVKIVLAEVLLNSDTGYNIQFIHINSGYY